MLRQSFTFVTGRVQYESEGSKALIPNVLLGYLYSHLDALEHAAWITYS